MFLGSTGTRGNQSGILNLSETLTVPLNQSSRPSCLKMLLSLPRTLEISLENRKDKEQRLGTASKPLSMTSSLKEFQGKPWG